MHVDANVCVCPCVHGRFAYTFVGKRDYRRHVTCCVCQATLLHAEISIRYDCRGWAEVGEREKPLTNLLHRCCNAAPLELCALRLPARVCVTYRRPS